MPLSATNIRLAYDLDTGETWVSFSFVEGDLPEVVVRGSLTGGPAHSRDSNSTKV